MSYQELKAILNKMQVKPSSKETILAFFSDYKNFDEPAIKTKDGVGYVEWNPLSAGGNLILAFDNNKVQYIYNNKYGFHEEGLYQIHELKALLKDEKKRLKG